MSLLAAGIDDYTSELLSRLTRWNVILGLSLMVAGLIALVVSNILIARFEESGRFESRDAEILKSLKARGIIPPDAGVVDDAAGADKPEGGDASAADAPNGGAVPAGSAERIAESYLTAYKLRFICRLACLAVVVVGALFSVF